MRVVISWSHCYIIETNKFTPSQATTDEGQVNRTLTGVELPIALANSLLSYYLCILYHRVAVVPGKL